MRIISLQ